jgi:hypothetical protein
MSLVRVAHRLLASTAGVKTFQSSNFAPRLLRFASSKSTDEAYVELPAISGNPALNKAKWEKKNFESANVTHRQKVLNGEISLPSHFGHHLREIGAHRSKAARRRV